MNWLSFWCKYDFFFILLFFFNPVSLLVSNLSCCDYTDFCCFVLFFVLQFIVKEWIFDLHNLVFPKLIRFQERIRLSIIIIIIIITLSDCFQVLIFYYFLPLFPLRNTPPTFGWFYSVNKISFPPVELNVWFPKLINILPDTSKSLVEERLVTAIWACAVLQRINVKGWHHKWLNN